jgi:S-adenosylmethionine-dependent methyltransferase
LKFEIGTLDTSRFQDAAKYASYLKTPAGRLRSELAWKNLSHLLPDDVPERRALDLGGGTGFSSVQLARKNFGVVLLDGSEQMLQIARQQAEASEVATRISFCHANANQLPALFGPESFDVVVCHNLLEYTEDPSASVRNIADVLRTGGMLSVLVRNRTGEVLKDAIKSGNWKLATASLTAETVADTLYGTPTRLFSPAELRELFAQAGLDLVAEHGVRVFFDYLSAENSTDAAYAEIFELESTLGARPEFFAIARYIQAICRRSWPFSSKVA